MDAQDDAKRRSICHNFQRLKYSVRSQVESRLENKETVRSKVCLIYHKPELEDAYFSGKKSTNTISLQLWLL